MGEEIRCDKVGPWKCFHCNEVFEEYEKALEHFGESSEEKAACQEELRLEVEGRILKGDDAIDFLKKTGP